MPPGIPGNEPLVAGAPSTSVGAFESVLPAKIVCAPEGEIRCTTFSSIAYTVRSEPTVTVNALT